MPDIETEEKKNSPENSITDTDVLPTCCTMATKDEDCHGNSWVEQQQKTVANQEQPRKKQKPKGKLTRSVAVCDESSPAESSNKSSEGTHTPSDNATSSECEEQEQGSRSAGNKTKKPKLSKELSLEYTDSTGIDLEDFLITTLKSSPRDRLMLLKLEQDMTDFMTDNCSYKKFPQMSSYHRMLVHRVAAYFGLEHNVDHSGKAVIINKSSNSRIPEQRFAEHVQEERTEERKSILKRESSQENEESQLRTPLLKEQKKSKSVEEREEEYQRIRDRIFSQDCPAQSVYIETRGPEDCCNMHNETQRRRQLFRASRDSSARLSSSRQSSLELEGHWSDVRPWSSTDSESSTWTSKPTHSRSDSCCKTDSGGSTLVSVLSPVAEAPPSNSPAYVLVPAEASILPGSILLNPHTGQPYLNPDGSPAVYNPPGSQQPMNTMQFQAPPLPHQQQPVTSHSLPQVQYSSLTYTPSQQALPVSSSQFHPPEQSREELSSQFSHMTLNHQSSGEESDVPTYYLHRAPPTHSCTQPQHNYAPPFSADSYISSETAVLPTQSCGQQNTQAAAYSYPGQCSNTSLTQHYGPAAYSTQTGYGGLLTNQQAYPNMVGIRVLPQTQQSIMGCYLPTSSYQMEPQLQSYSSPLTVSRHSGQSQNTAPPTGRSVFCNPVPPSPPPPVSMLGVTCQPSSCRNTCIRNQNQCWY